MAIQLIHYQQINPDPNHLVIVHSDQFVDIRSVEPSPDRGSGQTIEKGLELLLEPIDPAEPRIAHALIILNVPQASADGNEFPGIEFAINVDGRIVASADFTYLVRKPESLAHVPFTLVVRVDLQESEHTHVRAQWKSVRESTGHIESFASISAMLG